MEDTLRDHLFVQHRDQRRQVLILILMEDTLRDKFVGSFLELELES